MKVETKLPIDKTLLRLELSPETNAEAVSFTGRRNGGCGSGTQPKISKRKLSAVRKAVDGVRRLRWDWSFQQSPYQTRQFNMPFNEIPRSLVQTHLWQGSILIGLNNTLSE
jgi:hypothetical protein